MKLLEAWEQFQAHAHHRGDCVAEGQDGLIEEEKWRELMCKEVQQRSRDELFDLRIEAETNEHSENKKEWSLCLHMMVAQDLGSLDLLSFTEHWVGKQHWSHQNDDCAWNFWNTRNF